MLVLLLVGILLYLFKYIFIYIMGVILPAYEVTVSPRVTQLKHIKKEIIVEVDNCFYTGIYIGAQNSYEVVILVGKVDKPEELLIQEFQQSYSQHKKYQFDNMHGRADEFWRVLLDFLFAQKRKENFLTLRYGRHRVYYRDLNPAQAAGVTKSIKTVLRNARFIVSNGHGIST